MYARRLPGSFSRESFAQLASRVADLPGVCWLDGDAPHSDGRFSFLGCEPVQRIESRSGSSEPFAALAQLEDQPADLASPIEADAPGPGDVPRFIGYVAYDACFAGSASVLVRPPSRPVLSFARYDALIARSHRSGESYVVGDDEAACERLLLRLIRPVQQLSARVGAVAAAPREQHLEAIERALQHIAAGDIYQVNLARMWHATFAGVPLALWLRMREQGAVPLGFYYDDGERSVLVRTMERFLRWDRSQRSLSSRPIKGTIARAGDRDVHDAAALHGDAKERAEHAMIVDLMRNDLGRVAEVGSVQVPEVMVVEPYARLAHLVSTVTCCTRPDVTLRQVLDATFPPGSVTGTPKLRAMRVIESLEAVARDVYTGAVGYVDRQGGLSLAVAIRCAIVERDTVRYYAGGGIVEASEPERELAETELKARVFLDAVAALGVVFPR
jgi:anthranilate/para-aminobenzoate synthase component I